MTRREKREGKVNGGRVWKEWKRRERERKRIGRKRRNEEGEREREKYGRETKGGRRREREV